ncbi:polysaccharide deacetylase family protein [Gracilibacillus massiliensis]|uniref:polysaccharide deacetylase family protein n=1 Tax=Gracilibacillus massiliensis TaxID=1564956 RepID=UPI000A8CFF9C|nr:polysaccharide deacetylase family protein [Gracilibacillus massiliensis]
MFRKSIIMLLIIFLGLFSVACSNNESEEESGEEQITEEEPTEQETNTTDESEPETDEETSPDEDSEMEGETEQTSGDEEIKEAMYELNEIWNLVPIEEGTNEKVVLLTIDDAPDGHALEMAQTLDQLDAPAIFFVNGHFLESEESKDVLRQIHEMGFAIGNHTYNHQRLSEVDEETQKQEILELSELIEETIGEKPKFFRAPNGVNTDYASALVEEEGMLLMNWTYGYDWEADYRSKDAIADIMVNTELLTDGANLLMHDREWTAAALEDIVKGLREKGYEMADPMTLKLPE